MKTLAILILFISLYSCCTKKQCEDSSWDTEITLIGYPLNTSTIKLYTYELGSNYTILIDSFDVETEPSIVDSSNLEAQLPISVVDFESLIIVPTSNDSIRLDNIHTEDFSCNKCFPSRPKHDLYQRIQSYAVNGNMIEGNFIRIEK